MYLPPSYESSLCHLLCTPTPRGQGGKRDERRRRRRRRKRRGR